MHNDYRRHEQVLLFFSLSLSGLSCSALRFTLVGLHFDRFALALLLGNNQILMIPLLNYHPRVLISATHNGTCHL
jgi:hypothetical protein